ncbi:MAG: hypothetical protein HYX47_03630 [Burkholderiales bacterium]|nr:hypothetical protein [Burkholderiales bacterium]
MFTKRTRLIALGALLAVPALSWAQGHNRDRYEIRVINNWDQRIEVSITAERRDEDIRTNWNIAPKANTWLAMEGGRRVRVRGSDRITVRRDMRSVRISEVADFQNGSWVVSARDVVRGQRDKERR